jgi:hypothetical protein
MPEGLGAHPPHIHLDQTPEQITEEIRLACGSRGASGIDEFEDALQFVTFSGRDTISGSALTMSGAGRIVAVSLPYLYEGDSTESLAESLGYLATSLLEVQRLATARSVRVLGPDWINSRAGNDD